VNVSFGWTGGQWEAQRGPNGWTFKGGAMWITKLDAAEGDALARR